MARFDSSEAPRRRPPTARRVRPAGLLALAALSLLSTCRRAETPAAAGVGGGPGPTATRARPRTVGEVEGRSRKRPPVLFIGWDGADWQLLDELISRGAMPHLARLRDQSAWGILESEKPTLSPLLWTTMMTGVSPERHGVLDFSRFRPGDGVREPISGAERQVPALWNLATWAGKRVVVLGLWATHPAEAVDGLFVSDRFFGFLHVEDGPPPGSVFPPEREAAALEALREVRGETGLEALRAYLPWLTEAEYARHAEAERPYEHPISALRRILVETAVYDRVLRDAMAEGAPDVAILYLQGTDSIGHVFAPYSPPRQASIASSEFERYSTVAEAYFRRVDELLGAYVELADRNGAAIVLASDHGFHWLDGRPEQLSSFRNTTAARWHRNDGVYLVRAEGVTPGRGPNGSLRRIFPTLLALTGLPAVRDAEARPLAGLPAAPGPPRDAVAIDRALGSRALDRPPPGDDSGAEEIAKLRSLGYLGSAEPDRAPESVRATGSTRTAGAYNNLGVVLRGEGRDGEAREAFRRAIELDPGLASALWNLSDLLHAANELDPADDALIRALAHDLPEGVRYTIGRAIGYQRSGLATRSLALLERAVEVRPEERELLLFRGRYRVETGDCRGAAADFERGAELDRTDPAAPASAALAHLCRGDRQAAAEAARRSLALDPDQPRLRALIAGGVP